MKIILNDYLRELKSNCENEDATEATHYPTIKALLERIASERIKVTPQPKRSEVGVPDFIIRGGDNISLIGYLEAKDIPEENLQRVAKTDQLKRYIEALDNLILTNYLDFWLFRDSKLVKKIKLLNRDDFDSQNRFDIKEVDEIEEFFESFFSYEIKAIYTSRQLALQLARRTKLLRNTILEQVKREIPEEKGHLYSFLEAFKETLINDLSPEDFSDMYAQTISYGFFLARINANGQFSRNLAYTYIPKSIPLLNEVFQFVASNDLPEEPTFIVEDLTNILINADISNILREIYHRTGSEDPIIHFYETFLAKYNPKIRKRRGVYYTPEPVVSFIVRSVNELLKEKFGKRLGLADKEVKILDPACGTGTFLARIIQEIKEEVVNSGRGGLFFDFVREHILKDVYGFELMMSPYAMAHLNLSLALAELGYELRENDRLKVYLTNALESKDIRIIHLPFYEALTTETAEAQEVKQEIPILVVLANPPYSVSSSNKSEFIEKLMRDYKKAVKGETNIQPLSDDYIKFIRFAHWKIEQGGKGIFAYISNNSYLSGLIHRGMREELLKSFDEIYILNLHGNSNIGETCPDGSKDENVFDIKQGVGIALFVKTGKGGGETKVYYHDLYGLRKVKYLYLLDSDVETVEWEELEMREPYWFFVKKNWEDGEIYRNFSRINEIFNEYSSGVKTHNDEKLVKYRITMKDYDKPYSYRPFDERIIEYDLKKVIRHRYNIMKNFLFGDNLGLIVRRSFERRTSFKHCFITKRLADINFLGAQSYTFPLYLYLDDNDNETTVEKRASNLKSDFVKKLAKTYGEEPTPEQILFYCYGVMHSETYRHDYQEFLRIDFPRIPFTKDHKLFLEIADIGEKIGELHLLESPYLDEFDASYPIPGDHKVVKPDYKEKEQRLYINEEQYFGEVPKEVWEYTVGSYQVLDKYLKYRKGRELSSGEITHLLKVITAIKRTLSLLPRADELFDRIDLDDLVH